MVVDDYTGKTSRQWQSYDPQTASPSLYRTLQAAQIDESISWKLNSPMAAQAAHAFDFDQPLFVNAHPTTFESTPSQPDRDAYNTESNTSPNAPSLAPPFEYGGGKHNADMGLPNHDIESDVAATGLPSFCDVFSHSTPTCNDKCSPPTDDGLRRHHALPRSHNKKHKQSRGATCEWGSYNRSLKTKSHRCQVPLCDYACNRPEHLRRHEKSLHMKDEYLPCAFPGCIDPKTLKQREINSRQDNLKMHYTKTHFKYGASEKGGKNDRKSMKAAHEMGLSTYDHRWKLLLEGKMNVNQEIEENLHVWKMLGYSILETRNIKVKDVAPEWQTSGDEPLQKYDPRWKALWDGSLTFEKAIDTGRYMKESEAQGLLGVTMLETEAMGIKHLDPRWTVMLSGRMSVEQSEKLGVKHRNPVWKDSGTRRRTR